MRKTGKSSRPQLVLPSGMDPADLLSSLPADLVDHLKNTCDILVSNPKEGDPRIATALDGLGEGVAVVVDNGEIVWMNDRLADHPPEMLRAFSDQCAEAIVEFNANPEVLDGESIRLGFDFEDRAYEVICSPMPNDPERHKVAALLSDVSELRATERLIDQLDDAGAELLNLDPEIVNPLDVGARLRLLESRIVKTLKGAIGFEHFEVRLLDRKTGQLELVMGSGMQALPIGERIFARESENGITGWVAFTGNAYLCKDTSSDHLYITGIHDARSSVTVPLKLHDRVVGVVNVESDDPDAFRERDLFVLEIYGRYIAMAVNILDMLVVERWNTNSSLSNTILDEIADPLARIQSRARQLQELGNIDPTLVEECNRMLDDVELVKDKVIACTSGPQTVLGACTSDTTPVDDPILRGKRILVADDEAIIRETIGNVLKARGAEVETHADGVTAISSVKAAHSNGMHFDLVISDVRMPDCNGYEVFRAAKSCKADIPVILMTGFGYDPHHSIVRSSQEGLEAFLFKPFRVEQLLKEIHSSFTESD